MRLHMGAHLLEDSWQQHKKERPAFPCGICGIRAAIPQALIDPASQPGCGVSLKRTGSTWKPVHQCKLLQGASLEYSTSTAAKCAQSSPCTNRPVQCPSCVCVIWSYSMRDHFADKHPTTPMPGELGVQTGVTPRLCSCRPVLA